jgi:hypothetical protein
MDRVHRQDNARAVSYRTKHGFPVNITFPYIRILIAASSMLMSLALMSSCFDGTRPPQALSHGRVIWRLAAIGPATYEDVKAQTIALYGDHSVETSSMLPLEYKALNDLGIVYAGDIRNTGSDGNANRAYVAGGPATPTSCNLEDHPDVFIRGPNKSSREDHTDWGDCQLDVAVSVKIVDRKLHKGGKPDEENVSTGTHEKSSKKGDIMVSYRRLRHTKKFIA